MTLVERTVHAPEAVHRAGRPLRFHVLGLAILVLALFPLMSPGSSWTSDEGAYALQVDALGHGGWAYEYRAAPHDPTGENFPIVLTDRSADGSYYPYAKHPVFPLVLRAATAVVGTLLGLHLLQLLAVVATAATAWLLAAEIDLRLCRPAFWLAAAGPVLINGYLIWAHAPSAALAGLSILAAVRIAKRGLRGWAPFALAAGLVAGVLVRSEGLLFAGAVVAALGWVLLRQHGVRTAVVAAAIFGIPPVVATWLEERWISSITGGATQGVGVRGDSGGGSYLAGRISGAWHELLQTSYGNARASTLGLVALVGVVGGGLLALRRSQPHGWLGRLVVCCMVAIAATAARFVVAPAEPVTGLFAAWPVALLGIAVVPWRSAPSVARFLGAVGGLYLLAILVTQYPEGGGMDWGGRFLSPSVAIVAVLAVLGLRSRLDAMPDPIKPAVIALAAVAITSAGFGVATVADQRHRVQDLVAAVSRHPANITITVEPSLPRLAWKHNDTITWMSADQDAVPALLARLHEQGVHQVSAMLPEDFPLDGLAYTRSTTADEPALASVHGKLVVFRQ